MTAALTFGAGPTDTIMLLAGSNPPVAVGTEAPNAIVARVVASDGVTAIAGASVYFSTTPAAPLSTCAGASSCTVLSDEFGMVSTRITPAGAGVVTISAVLAPASYPSPKSVQATVVAQTSALDIALLLPSRWVAQGATVNTNLSARVLSYGNPLSGKTVNFQVIMGSAVLTAASATSNASGYASTIVQLTNLSSQVQVSACVAPGNSPCAKYPLNIYAVPLSTLHMQAVAGRAQLVPVGVAFQPVVVRITDSASPPNSVLGAAVTFSTIVSRPDNDVFEETGGERGMPVILASAQNLVLSDSYGLASLLPGSLGISGPVEIDISAMAGTAMQTFESESAWMPPGTNWSSFRARRPAQNNQRTIRDETMGARRHDSQRVVSIVQD